MSMPRLVAMGIVLAYAGDECAPASLQDVQMTGSLVDGHEVLVRAGPLEGITPFAIGFDGQQIQAHRRAKWF